MSIQTILVSQPKPEGKSPYDSLVEKYGLEVDFRRFIQVEGVSAQEFRQQRVDLEQATAVIFTSRTAVDHYFRIAEEMRYAVPNEMKYFCISESTALYLQNYVTYRKRKVFFGKQTFKDLLEILKKHKSEHFLFPCSDIHKQSIPDSLDAEGLNYDKAILYRTVASDLSDLEDVYYDLLVFFSPSGIESLLKNFPDFKQNKTRIAAFGPTTANAVKKNNLRLDIHAPMPNAPSMTMAIEQYIDSEKKKKK